MIEWVVLAVEDVSCAEDEVGLAAFSVLDQIALGGKKCDAFWICAFEVGGFELAFACQADAHCVLRSEVAAVVDPDCPLLHLCRVSVEMRSQQGILRLQCTDIRYSYLGPLFQVNHVMLFQVVEGKVQIFLNFFVLVVFRRS